MNDTKKEQTGWTSADNSAGEIQDVAPAVDAGVPGWDAAQGDRLAKFEQRSRARSAVERVQRNERAERVERVEERDVTDPSRVHSSKQQGKDRDQDRDQERAPQAKRELSPAAAVALEKIRAQRAKERDRDQELER